MLDPRIYRTGLIAVALGAIVLAFSLTSQPGPASTTLAPEAFNGQNAYLTMLSLAQRYPDRQPGSTGDDDVATYVAKSLRGNGFAVTTTTNKARTALGTRTLETVTGVRAGQATGSIVVVAHRDSLGSPAVADMSGTAALLELARVLSGETQQRSIVLASVSGSAGAAGATQLARTLPAPVDAVITLGDLASDGLREPVVIPWSNGIGIAPPLLRNTVAAALGAQAGLRAGGTSLVAQLAHLALPLTISEQGPFGARGQPAVGLSLTGERGPAPDARVSSSGPITQLGRTVLQSVTALDGGPPVQSPSAYLLYDGKVIPPWAIRVLVLTLILPVLMTTVDGIARARRRGHSVFRWLAWVIAAGLPFLVALGLTLGAKLIGLLDVTPPGPVAAGAVPLESSGVVVLLALACAITATFVAWRPLVSVSGGLPRREVGYGEGAAGAVLLVMCAVSLLIWARNPYAAALIVPALHLWMWVVDPDLDLPRSAVALLLLGGIAPPVLLVVYYAVSLGLGPAGTIWNGLLLVAGGHVTVLAAVEWSILLGCFASILSIAMRAQRLDHLEQTPVTVRGPLTYAGPGSLGGTESALRR